MKSSLIFCLLALVTGFPATAQNKYWSKFKDTTSNFEPYEVQNFDLTSYSNFDSIVVNIDVVNVNNREWTQVYINDTLSYSYGIDIGFKSANKKLRVKNDSYLANRVIFRFQGYGWKVGLDDVAIKDFEVYSYDQKLVLNNTGTSRTFGIALYNGLGQKIQEQSQLIQGKQEFDLDVSPGVYTVIIRENEKVIYKKMLIQ